MATIASGFAYKKLSIHHSNLKNALDCLKQMYIIFCDKSVFVNTKMISADC